MEIELVRNNRYWDPKTKTHLTRSNKTREFSDEEIEELDMSNIEYAIDVGILETDSEDLSEKDEEDEEKENTCKAKTSSGNDCSNVATWPEEDPQYCHIDAHRKNHEDYDELVGNDEDELEEVEDENITEEYLDLEQ